MQAEKKHIVLVTNKQPSSNPRLLKEAVALSVAGYTVTVIYNFWSHWAEVADATIINNYPTIRWIKVGADPAKSKAAYWYTRLRHKLYKLLADLFSGNLFLQVQAASQYFPELKKQAASIKADLYIAHNMGALPAAAYAASKNGTRYAFDAEDFHRGQEEGNAKEEKAVKLVEDFYLPGAAFITAASPLIAQEYQLHYPSLSFYVINNVFSLRQQPAFADNNGALLKLFWFSQTVGLKRGVQDVIAALNEFNDAAVEFTILGDTQASVKQTLNGLLTNKRHHIYFKAPCDEKSLIAEAATHHIGLALEPGFSVNNRIALSNKLFTYLLAGNAVVMTATPAQQQFYTLHPEVGWCYAPGNIAALKAIIRQACSDQHLLQSKRMQAWKLAQNRYNFEYEQTVLLDLVKQAV